MIGKTVSHYKITRELGAGGMGVVYEAEDLDLQVKRALKFLPPHAAVNDDDLRRLTREARAAAGLEHPNICQVHEIGHDGDQTFIVMSYLEGQTLAERLEVQGTLPLEMALKYNLDIGRALSMAHRAGVVHRDIKPANVMLMENDEAVVMDFGLAKGGDLSRVTQTGATLGTAAYMSPEQARGDQVDERTDIWSLGVVLYEMMTGRVPFQGDHLAAVAYAVQHKEPESPQKLRPEMSDDMDRILGRALAKEPPQRYQSIEEFLADLVAVKEQQQLDGQTLRYDRARRFRRNRTLVSVLLAMVLLAVAAVVFWPRSKPIRSLAVLPFANLSGNPEQEYLAEGMTDALIFELSRLTNLPRVISRSTIKNYKDSELTLPEIARELQVDAVVESSLLQTGGTIRASIKLIEAGSEETLWADSYEQTLDNILGLYGMVTRDIAEAIGLELSPGEREKLTTTPEVDPAAYEAYLKGRFWLGKDKKLDHVVKSRVFFEEAIALDPGFAPAQAGLAQIYVTLFVLTEWADHEFAVSAREAAAKALEMDPGSVEGRAAQASVYAVVDGDWAAADREWSKIDLRDRENGGNYPLFLCFSARCDEAVDWSRKLRAKEPMSQDRIKTLGMSLMYARRFEEALPVYEHLLEYYPDAFWGKYGLSVCLERTGRHEEAWEIFPDTLTSSNYLIMGDRARVLGVIGDLVDRMEESGNRHDAFHLSRHYAWLGDKKQALFWLKIASEESPRTMLITNVVAEFDFLRSEPAFQDCLRRAGFTEGIVADSNAMTSNTIIGGH